MVPSRHIQKDENYMSDKLLVKIHPELKRLIDEDADRLQAYGGMSEIVAKILADHYKRPELAQVPRKRAGRPSKHDRVPA